MKISQSINQKWNNYHSLQAAPKEIKKDSIEEILQEGASEIGLTEEDDKPVTINLLYDDKLTSIRIDNDGTKEIHSVKAPGPKAVGNDPPMKVSVLRGDAWTKPENNRITGKNIALMVHGFGGDSGDLLEMAKSIRKEQNFDEIIAVDYDKGYFIDDIGRKLSKVIGDEIPSDAKITIVTHSMGGLVSRSAMENHGLSERVNKLITLGTPHTGVRPCIFLSHIPGTTPEYYDMAPGSDFLTHLNDSKPTDTKYYATIGTEGKYLTKYWTVKYLGETITNAILGDKDNDGLVPSKSSGYNLMGECSAWQFKKFPVNHTYLHGGATLGGEVYKEPFTQVNEWLKQ